MSNEIDDLDEESRKRRSTTQRSRERTTLHSRRRRTEVGSIGGGDESDEKYPCSDLQLWIPNTEARQVIGLGGARLRELAKISGCTVKLDKDITLFNPLLRIKERSLQLCGGSHGGGQAAIKQLRYWEVTSIREQTMNCDFEFTIPVTTSYYDINGREESHHARGNENRHDLNTMSNTPCFFHCQPMGCKKRRAMQLLP